MSRTILLMTFLAIGHSPALRATTYSAVLNEVLPVSGQSLASTLFLASSLPPFSADFAVDNVLEVVYSAPAGYHFSIHPVPGGLTGNLQVVLSLLDGDSFYQESLQSVGELLFEETTGQVPVMSPYFETFTDGSFSLRFRGDIDGPFSFKSVAFRSTAPASYSGVFSQSIPFASIQAVVFDTSLQFPEPFAFLEADRAPVPEPASASLFLTGAAVLVLGSRVLQRLRVSKPEIRARMAAQAVPLRRSHHARS